MLIDKLLSFYKSEGLSDWKIYIVKPSWKYRKYDIIYFTYTGLICSLMIFIPNIKESIIPLWLFLAFISFFLIDGILSLAIDKGPISWLFKNKKKMVTAYFEELEVKTKKGNSNDWIYKYREQKIIEFLKSSKNYNSINLDRLIDELRSRQQISTATFMSVGLALIVFFNETLNDFLHQSVTLSEMSLAIKLAFFTILLPIFKFINSPYKILIGVFNEMSNRDNYPKK